MLSVVVTQVYKHVSVSFSMSEYPIQFKDGTWGWRHALDDDFEPDMEAYYEEEMKGGNQKDGKRNN